MRQPGLASLSLAAIVFGATLAAQEPSPPRGVRLVYELPVDAMQRQLRGQPADLERLLADTVTTIAKRLGDDAKVAREGGTGFVVDVPAAKAGDLEALRRRIEAPGTMTIAAVATAARQVDGAALDLDAAKQLLNEWLAAGGRERVLVDAAAIDTCNDKADAAHPHWVVHRILPQEATPALWDTPLANSPLLATRTVRLFTDEQWNGGAVPKAAHDSHPFLIELVPLDLRLASFSQHDLDPASIAAKHSPGGSCLLLSLQAARRADFQVWTRMLVGQAMAIVCNGELRSVPILRSAIPGDMVIEGNFTATEAEDLAMALRSGELPAIPKLVRQEALPTPGK